MPAALAFNPDIGAGPYHFPYLASAWMLFFHFNEISKLKHFWLHKSTPILLQELFRISLPEKKNRSKPGLSFYLHYSIFFAWIYFYETVQFCNLEELLNVRHKAAQYKPAAVFL